LLNLFFYCLKMIIGLYILLFFKIARCCTVTVGGQTYDLASLETAGSNGVVSVTSSEAEYTFEASFCSDRVACGAYIYGNMVRSKSQVCEGVYGKWSTATNTKTTNGYQAEFTSTQYCSDDFSVLYKSTFNFLCDNKAGTLGTVKAEQVGSNTCEYSVDVYTDLVCAGSTPIHTGGDGGGGLSGGSIFLILLVVLVFVYFFAGFGWNYYKHKTVKTLHGEFWCTKLPYWTKTGCMVSWFQTITCCKFSYAWCCVKICKGKAGDDKMATGLIGGEDEDD